MIETQLEGECSFSRKEFGKTPNKKRREHGGKEEAGIQLRKYENQVYEGLRMTHFERDESGIAHIQKRQGFWPNKREEAKGSF